MNQSFLEQLLQRQVLIGEAVTTLMREHVYTHRAIEEMLKLERLGNSRQEVEAASERVAARGATDLGLPKSDDPMLFSVDRVIDPMAKTPAQPDEHVVPVKLPPLPDGMTASRTALLESVDRLRNLAEGAAAARRGASTAPIAQEDGPTEVVPGGARQPEPAPVPVSRRPELLESLIGRKSVFCRYFAPNTFAGGRGFLQIGHAGLKQYSQDVLAVPTVKLLTWPTGFYFNAKTGARQLMVNIPIGLVVVDDTDKPDSQPVLLPRHPELHGQAFLPENLDDTILEQMFVHLRDELEKMTKVAMGE